MTAIKGLTRSADFKLPLLDSKEKESDTKPMTTTSITIATNISIIVNTQAKYLVLNNPIPSMHSPTPVNEENRL